jgi:hypothetical protein
MKREAARYVSKCDTCQKVKADYMKRDDKSMDFIVGLLLMARQFDSI